LCSFPKENNPLHYAYFGRKVNATARVLVLAVFSEIFVFTQAQEKQAQQCRTRYDERLIALYELPRSMLVYCCVYVGRQIRDAQ